MQALPDSGSDVRTFDTKKAWKNAHGWQTSVILIEEHLLRMERNRVWMVYRQIKKDELCELWQNLHNVIKCTILSHGQLWKKNATLFSGQDISVQEKKEGADEEGEKRNSHRIKSKITYVNMQWQKVAVLTISVMYSFSSSSLLMARPPSGMIQLPPRSSRSTLTLSWNITMVSFRGMYTRILI